MHAAGCRCTAGIQRSHFCCLRQARTFLPRTTKHVRRFHTRTMVSRGHEAVVMLLLARGALVSSKTKTGSTPLHAATQYMTRPHGWSTTLS